MPCDAPVTMTIFPDSLLLTGSPCRSGATRQFLRVKADQLPRFLDTVISGPAAKRGKRQRQDGDGYFYDEGYYEDDDYVGTHTDLSAIREAEQALKALNAELEARVQQRTEDLARVTRFSTLLLTAAGEGIFGLDARGFLENAAEVAFCQCLAAGERLLVGEIDAI